MNKPTVIKGGAAVDDRGRVTYCNDLDMSEVKRFYMLENHQEGFVRAWHGHVEEAKWVTVVSGVAVVAAVKMFRPQALQGSDIIYRERTSDGWDGTSGGWSLYEMVHPVPVAKITRFTLYPNGDVLYIPPGYANGHMNLVAGTRVLHFSDKTLEETKKDDPRFDAGIHGWVWEVKER